MSKLTTNLKDELAEMQDLKAAAKEKDEKDFAQGEIDRIKAEINAEKEEEKPDSGSPKPSAKKKSAAKLKPSIPAEKKPAKKKKKSGMKVGDKDLEDMDCDELIARAKARREQSRKNAGKHKTESVITRIAGDLSDAGLKAIKSVSVADIKEDPKAAVKAFTKVSDIIEKALTDIKTAMKPVLESKDMKLSVAAKKDMDDIDKLIASIKKKYAEEA